MCILNLNNGNFSLPPQNWNFWEKIQLSHYYYYFPILSHKKDPPTAAFVSRAPSWVGLMKTAWWKSFSPSHFYFYYFCRPFFFLQDVKKVGVFPIYYKSVWPTKLCRRDHDRKTSKWSSFDELCSKSQKLTTFFIVVYCRKLMMSLTWKPFPDKGPLQCVDDGVMQCWKDVNWLWLP